IQPVGYSNKCLDVRGAVFANGTPVQMQVFLCIWVYDCNGSQAQKWIIKRGRGSVQVAGTSLCLDAGSSPANEAGMKIWQCYDDLAAQTWFYDGDCDERLVRSSYLLFAGQCHYLTDGDLTNGPQTQTWANTLLEVIAMSILNGPF
ncbi:carbohydrate-binding module family 13 protein, partial [Mycena leptocephala]